MSRLKKKKKNSNRMKIGKKYHQNTEKIIYPATLVSYKKKKKKKKKKKNKFYSIIFQMSLPNSYSCRLSHYTSLEKLFAPNSIIPYPSHVYIYGNNHTGKSTIVKYSLNKYNHFVLWLDCRELYSLNMFYHTFISLLSNNTIPLMKNFKIMTQMDIYFIFYLN